LERSIGLLALQDRNEHLFCKLVMDHMEEFLPIVYTPTVGRLCQEYSRMFRKPRGIWITPQHKGRIEQILRNAPFEDVRLIVVTDNERILGLGDQGAGGMGIPIGKLALYTAAGGIHPTQTLPISLDVGTDNKELLDDELYLGYRAPRLRGEPYRELVEEFVQAVSKLFPKALLQWEDFKKQNALDLLAIYRKRILSFNDDIQGTAGVTLSAILASGRITGTALRDQRIVILGAGGAGIGIGRLLRDALSQQGVSGRDLVASIAMLDSKGLLVEGRPMREASKKDFTWPVDLIKQMGMDPAAMITLEQVVEAVKPTVMIGTSGEPGAFSESIIRMMAQHCDQPTILPLSNPTSLSEATPHDLYTWTEGKALVATGSPYEAVHTNGKQVRIGQANNVFIFPGVGIGSLIANATEVTESMFTAAAQTLAECVSQDDLDHGTLLPPIRDLRKVSRAIMVAVVRAARDAGVGDDLTEEQIQEKVDNAIWTPQYPMYEPS
jgi:malic enzyme